GKAIINSTPPIYDQEPTMVVEDDEMSKYKEIDKLMANQDNSPRINRGIGYDNQRIVNVAEARENVDSMSNISQAWPKLESPQAHGGLKDDDDDDLANERDLLASLIEKLKCKVDDSKNRNKFLETSNKDLVDKLKGENEDFKTKNKV
nr:hypothetical protein [Tanacetum cinerariifolium]